MKNLSLVALLIITLFSCKEENKGKLQYFGRPEIVNNDTIPYKIPPFSLTNQDNKTVTEKDFDNVIYIADFFFTSCRTICPVMKKEMVRIQEVYKDEPRIKFISHTLDPNRDSPEVLNAFAKKLNANTKQWVFVTGSVDEIYDLAEKGYLLAAQQGENQPDGITHSGKIVLVDTQKHVRGFYTGTDPDEVDLLIADIKILLSEND